MKWTDLIEATLVGVVTLRTRTTTWASRRIVAGTGTGTCTSVGSPVVTGRSVAHSCAVVERWVLVMSGAEALLGVPGVTLSSVATSVLLNQTSAQILIKDTQFHVHCAS